MNSNEKRCRQRILKHLNRFPNEGLSTGDLCRILPHSGYIVDEVLEMMVAEGDIVIEGTMERSVKIMV